MVTKFLLKLPQVEAACGLKKSTIYQRIKEGKFPQPVSLGNRSVAWNSNEIQDWIDNRPRCKTIS